jgi:PAS domain S-box-containing protein
MGTPVWGFMPHGHCYLWTPSLVLLEVVTNALIGLAYVSIAASLAYIVSKIEDLPFERMYLAFGVFILSCGITHFFDVLTIWYPIYWADGGVRVLTAVASVGTAVLLIPLTPKAIALADAAGVAHARGLQLEVLNRELAEMTERTKREYHRVIAETLPQKVWVASPSGDLEYVNDRWTDFTGQKLEDARSGGWLNAVHPEDRERARAEWERALSSGGPFSVEYRLRGEAGDYVWHLSRALPFRQEGQILRWIGTATDIDAERRASEERAHLVNELRQAVRARDEFLSVASHELRTPLTTIGLQVESMASTARGVSAPFADRCAVVKRQTDRLDKLVGALLEVSKFATGRVALELEQVDLTEVVREVVAEGRGRAAPEQSIQVHAEGPAVGTWDRLRLIQIATNLVGNALKYGRGRPIDVTVRTEADAAILEVTDHGIGISAEDRERIFDRFERAVSGRHYGGLGLGLWITREIVKVLGGQITVESTPGEGSTFTVRIPKRKDD